MSGGILFTPAAATPGDEVLLNETGFVSWNYYPNLVSTNTAPTSQTIYCMAIGLYVGDTVSNVCVGVGTAASGTAPTGIYGGLCDSTGVMLGQSANLAADAMWTSTGIKVMPLGSTVTITETGLYYVVFLKNGAFASTDVALGRITSNWSLSPSSVKMNGTMASQATLPANGNSITISATFLPYWAAAV